jgi:DNA-binding response OmpR family regulator
MPNSKKILVIDDDIGVLQAVSTALEINNYQVVATSDEGYIDTAEFEKAPPDLILLDMLLSGADGREVCLKLKGQKKTRDIPVIIFSAASNAMRSAKKAKADAFLPKPFAVTTLLATIEEVLPPTKKRKAGKANRKK